MFKSGSSLSSKSENILHKRSRIKKLLIETHDLSNDPYYKINSIGKIECQLCLTTHNSEYNYIVHKQGYKHQLRCNKKYDSVIKKDIPKYRCFKIHDRNSDRQGYQIRVSYPDALFQPSFKFLGAEDLLKNGNKFIFKEDSHRKDLNDKNLNKEEMIDKKYKSNYQDFQYLVIACNGFESIGFKIQNREIEEIIHFYNSEVCLFYIQFMFK
ncbi:Pre-mRNA-splicing factor sap62 [Dictyocoela muelleri]|nr:Pre-mRNA-splicing factor sap62 [Dictyocoela muelleri]